MSNKEFLETLSEGRFVDYTMVFLIGRRLLRKVKDWPAFKLGLLDENGKVIKKPVTSEEKDSLTLLDRFILQLKTLIKPKNLLLLTPLLLFKESIDWSDAKARDESEIIKSAEDTEKAKKIIIEFNARRKEEFEDEDKFWNCFMRIYS